MKGDPSRRITAVLFAAQCLASAAFIATSTVGAIAGAGLSGRAGWAGVPAAASTLAGSGASFLWGILMDRMGRRPALVLGLLVGAAGAAVAVIAIGARSFPLFLLGMMLIGVASAAVTLARFVAAEVSAPAARGRAVSYVVLGGTAGAIGGPLLVQPAGHLSMLAGNDELSGAFAAAVLILVAAGVVVTLLLRPEPKTLAAVPAVPATAPVTVRTARQVLRQPAAMAASAAMILSQVVMAGVMVITSLYMKGMNHGLGDISLVISAHTIGMYGFSLVSGRLLDTWGRRPVIITGAVILLGACLTAPLTGRTIPIAVSLLLLGLGWNFCFVGGSTLLSDQLAPAERGRTQGFNDLLVGAASGIGSLGSGLLAARFGYAGVGLAGAALSLLPFLFLARWRRAVMAP
jgi:MFS family permease